ncbi:thioredoxin-like protein [Crassisporium funariophilum]|nr:thioredoxin-like protein [Crassisporium funariophilum]
MVVQVIESLAQFKEIINGKTPAIIDFWATWCGPCRAISPVLDKFSDQAEFEGVKFYKVDVDAQAEIGQEVGIRAMPTFMLFQNGSKAGELVGANPQKLQDLVKTGCSLLSKE